MFPKSPLLIAIACLYRAHLISEPVRKLTAGGGLILEGVGRLLNDLRVFVFEVLRDLKEEIQEIFGGVHIQDVFIQSGIWCVDDAVLIPEQITGGYLEADPIVLAQVIRFLRAAVGELARGAERVRHSVIEGVRSHIGTGAVMWGRK